MGRERDKGQKEAGGRKEAMAAGQKADDPKEATVDGQKEIGGLGALKGAMVREKGATAADRPITEDQKEAEASTEGQKAALTEGQRQAPVEKVQSSARDSCAGRARQCRMRS